MKKYQPCEQCFRSLYNINRKAAMFWLQLVEDHCDSQQYLFFCLNDFQIDVMERNGYVLSHETLDRILFVLQGKQDDHFCVDPDNHNSAACA